MPRPKAPHITGVTDDLFAMDWENENAVRMWFRRRGTTPFKLGLVVDLRSTGRVTVRRRDDPPPADAVVPPPTLPTAPLPEEREVSVPGDVVRPAAAERPVAAPDDIAFEDFAEAVDGLLLGANEDPVSDAVLRELLFADRLSPREAFDLIIQRRVEALAPKPKAKPPAPVPVPDVVLETKIQQGIAAHAESPPVLPEPLFIVQIGMAVGRDDAQRLATEAARALHQDVVILSADAREAIQTFAGRPRGAPPHNKKDHWPKVEPLLERADGASVDDIKRVLGWQTAPGKWFFEKWARDAGRLADLEDLGLVNEERRFRLRRQAA